jgi:hypothetical protein
MNSGFLVSEFMILPSCPAAHAAGYQQYCELKPYFLRALLFCGESRSFLLQLRHDVLRDGEARRCRGTRGVEHMQRTFNAHELEVLD